MLKRFMKVAASLLTAVAVLACTAVPTFAAGKHKVTFLYGTKSYVATVDDGATALPPTDTYMPGYVFMGWVGNAADVHSDVTILGAYSKVDVPAPAPAPAPQAISKTYVVRFVDTLTNAEYYRQTVSEGANANPPEVPHHDGYHFDGYDGTFTNVTSDRTIYVRYGWDYSWHDDPSDYWWYWADDDGDIYYTPYWWM